MNKFFKCVIAFTLLLTMLVSATGCQLISSLFPEDDPAPVEPNPEDKPDEPVLTGVDKVIYDARKETDARIEEIRNTPNMEIPEGATVYYVSEYGDDSNDGLTEDTAWLTLDKVNSANIPAGAYVCFQRGTTWRGQLVAKRGVTYTAYGEGDKPIITASPENGADSSKWVETEYENVWRYTTKFDLDVGCIIFNDGEEWGRKTVVCATAISSSVPTELKDQEFYNATTKEAWSGLSDLDDDLHFYHNCYDKLFDGDTNDKYVYLYSEENPGERFDSIEFSIQQHVITVNYVNDVTIDNIAVKYGGAHGISAIDVENFNCTNLEVGYIGGSYSSPNTKTKNVRYGNGIQVWDYCDGWTVENCYIYQCYDTAVTPQGSLGSATKLNNEHNITITGNVMEYYNWGLEYWLGYTEEVKQTYKNFLFEDNYMWYAGQGICETRKDWGNMAHIRGGSSSNTNGRNYAENFVIKNNVMIGSERYMTLITWQGDMTENEKKSCAPQMYDNVFVGKENNRFIFEYYVYSSGYWGKQNTMDKAADLLNGYGENNEVWVMK